MYFFEGSLCKENQDYPYIKKNKTNMKKVFSKVICLGKKLIFFPEVLL